MRKPKAKSIAKVPASGSQKATDYVLPIEHRAPCRQMETVAA